MTRTITFNELRSIKDNLPNGCMAQIAEQLGVTIETVRNYFGGCNFKVGNSTGFHIEPGPDGGLVILDSTDILELAKKYVKRA